jgi:hypothetical protein
MRLGWGEGKDVIFIPLANYCGRDVVWATSCSLLLVQNPSENDGAREVMGRMLPRVGCERR